MNGDDGWGDKDGDGMSGVEGGDWTGWMKCGDGNEDEKGVDGENRG